MRTIGAYLKSHNATHPIGDFSSVVPPNLNDRTANQCPAGADQATPHCDETYQAEIPTRQNALGPTGAMTEPYPARLGVRARSE